MRQAVGYLFVRACDLLRIADESWWHTEVERLRLRGPYEARRHLAHRDKRPNHQRSSRCCDSSSTISLSRAGESCSDDSRVRTSRAQSGMFVSRHPAHGIDEGNPCLLLLCQHAPTFSRDLVEAAAPFAGVFDPDCLDPSTLLGRIALHHGRGPVADSARARLWDPRSRLSLLVIERDNWIDARGATSRNEAS